MLVFDGSGSMAGTDMNSVTPHIAKVREALAHVLPRVAPVRDLGLIVYGPGGHSKCDNIELRLRPAAHSVEEIMAEINSVVPAGQTPLTTSVRLAAEALQFQERAAQIVLLTDGEETCGGDPCELARTLGAEGRQLTVHVVGFRPRGTPSLNVPFKSWCLADETGGQYLSAETEEELIEALQKTLGCPFITKLGSEGLVR
jgi:Ca-activated chloride channel family protein